MKEYIDKIIEEFTYMEEVKTTKSAKAPEAQYLFTMNPNGTHMDAEKVDMFHDKIDKTLYICKREITDIK